LKLLTNVIITFVSMSHISYYYYHKGQTHVHCVRSAYTCVFIC